MKRILWLMLAGVFLAAGCSQSPTEQGATNIFDDENGGFTTASELPAFGDPELEALEADEADPGDPETAAIQADLATHPDRRYVFALRVIWGQPRLDTSSTTPTDWSGGVVIDEGAIGVLRTIRFEPATDYLEPRTERNIVRFASVTTIHNDGLLLLIAAPAAMLADSSDNRFSFRTGPLSLSFTLRELATLDTAIAVDDVGNMVLFNGMLLRPQVCPRGFLGGIWQANADTTGGEFKGRWISRDGRLAGHLMGRYGIDSEGRRVFYGKYIDANGNFEGMLRGVWGPYRFNKGGFFKGVYFDPMDRPAGRLHGHWKAEEAGNGVFQGVWKAHCPHWERHRWQNWRDKDFDPGYLDREEFDVPGNHGDDPGEGQADDPGREGDSDPGPHGEEPGGDSPHAP